MKYLIKKAFKKLGYSINEISPNSKCKHNVFASDYKKRALISILKASRSDLTRFTHTAYAETWLIAEVLHELGYQVDIVRYSANLPLDELLNYDYVIGYGEPINLLLTKGPSSRPLTVCYITGSHITWQQHQTAKRLKQAFEEKNIVFRESWRVDDNWWLPMYHFADSVIVAGNQYTASTYSEYTLSPVYPVPLFAFKTVKLSLNTKNYDSIKQSYLWIGGGSLVHKGLDIVIDYFLNRPDLELHICGNIEREPQFNEYYMPKIKSSNNIHYHGFIKIDSDEFSTLMHKTTFVIVPSCAEGGTGSVLMAMVNGGLIPILTPECGIDIGDYGININGFKVSDIEDAVKKSESLTTSEIKKRSNYIFNDVSENYTQGAFKNRVRHAINESLRSGRLGLTKQKLQRSKIEQG